MPHPTDGQLHAFLDRAMIEPGEGLEEIRVHLEGCADCRHRLEEAKALRGRAHEILGRATPGRIDAPPFATLAASSAAPVGVGETRSGASGAPGRDGPGFKRPQSLAWAASVAIALTAGWIARASFESPEREPVAAASEEAVDAVEALVAQNDEISVVGTAAQGEAGIPGGPAEAPDVAGGLEEQAESFGGAEADQGTRAEAPPAPSRELVEGAAAKEMAAGEIEGDAVGAARLREHETAVADSDLGRARLESPDAGTPGYEEARAPLVAPPGWRSVDRTEAEQVLGGPALAIPNLPVVSRYASVDDEGGIIWTTQVLASGHTLDLFQQAGGEAEDRGPQSDGVYDERRARGGVDEFRQMRGDANELLGGLSIGATQRIRVGDFLVEARAPVSADSLTALLRTLED